jgi:hypothetical protein
MMVGLYRTFAAPLTHEMLFAWHTMLTKGRRDLKSIGRYRTGAEPIEVVSGSLPAPKVHFEAPPSSKVAREMARFVKWFNRTAPSGSAPLPALTRAGMAHLYFESIHPFEDGNAPYRPCDLLRRPWRNPSGILPSPPWPQPSCFSANPITRHWKPRTRATT